MSHGASILFFAVLLPLVTVLASPCLQMVTLRGSILEDSVASTARHGTARGLPLKEVLECVAPELSVSCLRLALNTPKVTEQLLKLDEQGVSVFCLARGGQGSKVKEDDKWPQLVNEQSGGRGGRPEDRQADLCRPGVHVYPPPP